MLTVGLGALTETDAMLLSCGDALIDFLPVKSTDGRDAIVPVVGGSCLNIAVGWRVSGRQPDLSVAFRPICSAA